MNVVIAAGGTGGHLYPAVALAREFLRQDPSCTVLFVGTARGIEGKVLPQEGFELVKISARPVMGRGIGRAAWALFSLPVGLWQSVKLLQARKADLAIGIGGYSSPPVLMAASLLRIPRVILEPNAYPGTANKVMGPLADRVFLAFEAAKPHFRQAKVRVVGTPIRRDFFENAATGCEARGEREKKDRLSARFTPHASRATLLIFGGSQGAHAINLAMIEALSRLKAMRSRLSIIHQTGETDHASVKAAYEAAGFGAESTEVVPFLFDMPMALRATDLVVSRAGAVTVAELTACGKAAVLIPLPQAIYRHQERNAREMEKAGAAVVLLQHELTGVRLARAIEELLQDPVRLRTMGNRSLAMGRTDSADTIVRECRTLVRGGHEINRSAGAAKS
jgi:UDP-N-acetylglucosamine--N-acetylmuramyl-(pentapeptide) pyrophosphoryl-undecaprenol N-acetylglucosamine transferase